MSEAEWAVPGGWTWANFDDVAAIAQDLVSPDKVLTLPHIAPNHIEGATGRLLDYRTVAEDEVISPKQRFFPGQIVFSKIRPYLRKAALVDFEGVCSADMYPLWPSAGVERVYLLRWLLSEDFRDAALAHQGRTLLPKINQAGLRATRIPVPPLPEQRRIVAKLDRLSAHSAAARRHLARAKQAILAAAFNGDLTADWREANGDQGWRSSRVGALIDRVVAGKNLLCEERPPQDHEQGVVKVSAVTWGRFNPMASKTLPTSFMPPANTQIRSGDLLISRANTLELVGACVIVRDTPDNLFLSDKVLRLDVAPAERPWLLHFLRSPQGRAGIEEGSTGNQLSMRNISQKALAALPMPWPPEQERREIVRRIEAAFARIDRLADDSARAARLLDRLDERLLAKAFRGELVSQDPADEPAAALLARLRDTRVAAPKRGRGRPRKGAA